MAATSLSEQLKKLSAPQSAIYKEGKKKASLLFDPKEAGLKDRDTFYEIGLSGLNDLIALYEGFRVYEDSLFSQSSKEFERAVQSKEVNQNLDQTIEKFLLQISPYFLLQSSHKALEWLVNRYHIHEYNQDAIMALILPYHGSNIFVRFIQIMPLKANTNRWNWLRPMQKNGVPLSNQVWYNHCLSNSASLQFTAKMTLKYVKEFGERSSQLNTVFAFFCQTALGVLESGKHVNEGTINALLPTVLKAIESSIVDFRSAAYIVLGFLFTKATLKGEILNDIVLKLLTTEFDMTYDIAILITMLYAHQTHMKHMSETILNNISLDIMNDLCGYMKRSVEHKQNIQPFVLAFLSSVLRLLQKDTEQFTRFRQLPQTLIDEVDLKNQQPESIVKCVLDAYRSPKAVKVKDADESDIEIIDEEDCSSKILEWYSEFLKSIENKYPDAFDKVIKQEMSSQNKGATKKRLNLARVLGFKPSVAHQVGGTYLFENLNNVNPELRVEAVKYISKEFDALKIENVEFVKDSIVNRLNDDDINVVTAALEIPSQYLNEALNEIDATKVLVNIVSKTSKKWRSVIRLAISKLCSLDILPVNQETVLSLVPYLFPDCEESARTAWDILNAKWGRKLGLAKALNLNSSYKDNHEVLNQLVFKALFVDRVKHFDDLLDVYQLNKNNTLDIYTFLLLKTCSFKVASVDEITVTLNLLLESVEVEDRVIVASSEDQTFSNKIMPEYVKLSKQNKILFEVVEYIFSRIIEDMPVKSLPKPWCNVCEDNETILVRRLYEICITGCAIPSYEKNYVNLLKQLLQKFFKNSRERFEFIANFACGHILYANDAKDVIGPELQLRSLKLLNNFFSLKDAEWLYESDVVVLMILFNLNNPITAIRQCAIDSINNLLRLEPDKNKVYVQLFTELLAHKEELLLDHEQIPQVLNTVLSQSAPATKIFKKNCLAKFTHILASDTPPHITSSFLKLLYNINSASTFPYIVSALQSLEKTLAQNELNLKFCFNIYESNMFKHVYSQINDSTITTFAKDQIWKSITVGLKEYRECILEEGQTVTSPCVLIMKQIDEDVFKKVPDERTKDLVLLIASAGAFSNNPTIASSAAKVMKKIHLNFSDFKPILQSMLTAADPAAKESKKKKSSVSMLSYQVTETNEWKLGVTMLEYVQNKKKMTVDGTFVSLMFELLSKCLRFEEQSYVEYTKQLILSSLWYYCKKFVDDKDRDQIKSLKSHFKVELVVQSIRGTQNPQTHHHALILLSHAAYMLPEQVLHHTMEIFTFMGSSVLRHDDAYSFQIIIKIIETLIPILVKLDRDVEEYSEKELQQLQNRIVPVLRIFADVVLHVPEHRRLPLYKKLVETLGPNQFLWVFLGLLLETHITHFNDEKKKDKRQNRTLADQESPMNRLDFGQNILLEFSPEVGIENFIKLMGYIKSLPVQKDEDSMDTDVDPSDIFSVNGHSAVQLRQYKYVIITFMNNCLASSRFIQHSSQATDIKAMETHYKNFIINILTFIQSISKFNDEKTAKYWRVMLHHSYDLLDNTNNLLSAPMFLSVVRGLLKHTLQAVRRKSMELLNSKIQFSPEMFNDVNKDLLFSLLPALLDIIKTIENKSESQNETAAQELELNQQTALLSLKLLTRMLASENPEPFKSVLDTVTEYTCNSNITSNVMASVVLCLAELCSNLKAHALASLRKFMPALIKVLKKQREAETPELILLSTVTAISKIVESLPLFLSPYLQKILYEYAILLAKWQTFDQECSKVSAIVTKLVTIKKKIASSIPPRVLIPVANETHQLLLDREHYDAIGPVMSVLAESFANVTTADFTALQQDLTSFFLSALQLRSNATDKDIDANVIDNAEDEVVNALVKLVLKLSETSFRPFYFKIYDWAIRTNVDGQKDRAITFYRLSSAIADQLKGLFVLFAGHFIKNASDLLDSCNNSKTEDLFYDSEEKCITLVKYIIKTLHIVFLYDSQNFINKDRFETLMQPVVDQLENTLGGIQSLKSRAEEIIIPCISQFAVASADDSLWKLLNYQILLKTRHNDADIRLLALDSLVSMATQLGSSWLPLLAESVPFLAELLEDGDQKIETCTKDAIRKLEQILGEPLEKYF
ncbi:HEAT repeat-containing protein 1 [Ostrinia furnacalis]|uniref:HEAT repeat-containing protein 1 n=1 Tax=Ostrinia furnacalis TaxID=93504 RepID=UPI00103D9B0F|nr:HEAT repeat-containing protein 1 [Ostrinia furnacalis]